MVNLEEIERELQEMTRCIDYAQQTVLWYTPYYNQPDWLEVSTYQSFVTTRAGVFEERFLLSQLRHEYCTAH